MTGENLKDKQIILKSNKNRDGKIRGGVFVYLLVNDGGNESVSECDLSGFPKERADEILNSKNEKVRRQKVAVWKLLLFAAKEIYGSDADEIRFEKTPGGKWICDKFCFSLSHTFGASAVVIAEKPCGVDVEYAPKFFEKCAYKPFIASFLKQIGENESLNAGDALKLWTQKESVYKRAGSGVFSPKKIDVQNENVLTEKSGDYVLSVSTTDKENVKIYVLKEI